ncbi:MAG: hypothetical protein FWC38_07800 [Proteobacteria bacterium]|nr:hypothetical protein [Pseudomonadota bacterium]
MSDVRGQMSDVRCQMSEVRYQKAPFSKGAAAEGGRGFVSHAKPRSREAAKERSKRSPDKRSAIRGSASIGRW